MSFLQPDDVIIGFRYSFAIHMGICRGPVNELIEIRVGDKTAWQGRKNPDTVAAPPPDPIPPDWDLDDVLDNVYSGLWFFINAGDLFGGDKGEGGILGTIELAFGKPDQQLFPGLTYLFSPGPKPAYRGVFTAIFNGQVCSMNPYPKPWAFRVRRTTRGWDGETWYPEKCLIVLTRPMAASEVRSQPDIHAMNPAHMLYECLTNHEWGRGLDPIRLDTASFVKAADRLYDEKFGLCLRWVRRDSIRTFMQFVLDHIGASMFNDRVTGKITLKLIRNDYVRDDLPLYEADTGLLSVDEAPVAALGPVVNECKVTYVDPITNKEQSVAVHNLGAMQATGGVFHSIQRNFPGIPTADLALRVAQRELRVNAVGLRRFKVKLDRRAWKLVPGGVFRIRDRSRGIEDTVLRIGRIESGTLSNGTITITAMNDVFSFPLSSYTDQQPNVPPPTFIPQPALSEVFEVPYVSLARYVPQASFPYIGDDAGFVGMVVRRPDPVHGGYNSAVKEGLPEDNEYPDTGTP